MLSFIWMLMSLSFNLWIPLSDQDLRSVSSIRNIPLNQTRPDQVDFLFVREYKTFNRARLYNPRKNGVQGAFFAVWPSHKRFEDLLAVLRNATFVQNEAGWGEDNFGDYWGAAQIQGFLSYYYYRFSSSGIELDHCRYNTLGQDIRYLPKTNGSCRTGGAVCKDCSVIPMREVVLGHLSRCLKPWWCKKIVYLPETPVCDAMVRQWFNLRGGVDDSLGIRRPSLPLDPVFNNVSQGYCQGKAVCFSKAALSLTPCYWVFFAKRKLRES